MMLKYGYPMSDVDATQFRAALRDYPTGVAIITARDADGKPVGLTANSFVSVSLVPPLVLWSIDQNSPLFDGLAQSTHYAVHVLCDDQEDLARQFADDNIDKFAGLVCEDGIADLPLLEHYSALFQCEVKSRHREGDHVVLVGRVVDMDNRSANPLVYHAGTYKALRD